MIGTKIGYCQHQSTRDRPSTCSYFLPITMSNKEKQKSKNERHLSKPLFKEEKDRQKRQWEKKRKEHKRRQKQKQRRREVKLLPVQTSVWNNRRQCRARMQKNLSRLAPRTTVNQHSRKEVQKLEDVREVKQGNILTGAVWSRRQKMVALAKVARTSHH